MAGARVAQWVVCWAHCPHDAVLWVRSSCELAVEGIFPMELTRVLTLFPKTLSDESIN